MSLSHSEITILFLSLGLLLGVSRLLGELCQRFHQPAVLGEIVAGLLLGPTVLGAIFPQAVETLFPKSGNVSIALQGITTFAIVMFLLVAGMEVDLSRTWRQGPIAIKVAVAGIIFPTIIALFLAYVIPESMGRAPGANPLIFSLFLATALSISALPVIAKILMDLNLYRTDFGIIIVSAAVLNDLVGWLVFALVLSLIGAGRAEAMPLQYTIFLTILYVFLMLTVARRMVHAALPWLQAYTAWPGGVLSFAVTLALFGAAFAEWIGVHAVFGSFMVGVAIGDSSRLTERTRTIIDRFISSVFAPLFFASIGLKLNFATYFHPKLVCIILVVACFTKVLGCTLGARYAGMRQKEALAIGFGMNARGAMEIILGLLALQTGIIAEPLFVALVFMALVTSMMSGPVVQRLIGQKAPLRLFDFLSAKTFGGELKASDRHEAIRELTALVCAQLSLEPSMIEQAVWAREETLPTGIANGIAVPHARIPGLLQPIVAAGISAGGIDFEAPDFEPTHVIFLVLTPEDDDGVQLEIISDIAKTFKNPEVWERLPHAKNYIEFLSVFKTT